MPFCSLSYFPLSLFNPCIFIFPVSICFLVFFISSRFLVSLCCLVSSFFLVYLYYLVSFCLVYILRSLTSFCRFHLFCLLCLNFPVKCKLYLLWACTGFDGDDAALEAIRKKSR
nr:MAG TPA: hypothetical protein [Caudoviricetes sp.]